jgi:DNA mismatch repair ATPase MutS
MWDLNLTLRAEKWRRVVGPSLRGWFVAIGELEAMMSLAALARERPDYGYPEFAAGSVFEAKQLAHPLIDRTRVVPNDLTLGGEGSVLILSGSNMSGKSTLLRSVGINQVMARAGGPVAAASLLVSDLELATSVRVVDSLAHGTSHFYAELARLKHVVDLAQASSRPVLYLLDEMLHGTNSRERYIGAVSVIRWLARAGAMGIVTTHDLALARVAEELPPGKATNRHFSDEVVEGKMRFDYRLREGPVASTNALRLMRVVGIDVDFGGIEPPAEGAS